MNNEEKKIMKIMERYCDCEECEPVRIHGYYEDGSTGLECVICDMEIYFEVDTEDGDWYTIRASDIPLKVALWQYM